MTPEVAYDEAIRRIHEVRASGAEWLDLGDLPIEAVPGEIRILKNQLKVLALGREKPVWKDGTLEWKYDGIRPALLRDVGSLGTLTGLTTLNLSHCKGLRDVGPLGTLTGLTTLNLSACEGLRDVGPLGTLTGLTTLDLSCCEGVTDIDPLGTLTGLTALNLSSISLTNIGLLETFTGLTTLNLSFCEGLRDFGPLGELTGLTTLDLCYCYGLRDFGPLGTLTNLTTLKLDSCWCDLTDVAPLGKLTGLTTLELSVCPSLTDVSFLNALANLTKLDLHQSDSLTNFCPIGVLTGLTTLKLSYCYGLRDVSLLGNLTELTTLDLSNCYGLRDVSLLGNLTELSTLDLSYCSNFAFAPIRSLLSILNELRLYQTNLTDLPDSICGESPWENVLDAVRAYYDDLGADPVGDAERKVFLLGNGRVGKTKLARRLMDENYGAEHEPSTHGVRLGTLSRKVPGVPDRVRLNLWDFGGQDIYLGSHALFLQGQAVFLLLWHPDHERGQTYEEGGFAIRDRPLAYWLDYLRGLAGVDRDGHRVVESPILLIRSRCDSEADETDPPFVPDRATFPRLVTLNYGAKEDYNREFLDAYLNKAVKGLVEDRRKQPLIGKGRAAVREAIRAMQAKPEARRTRILERAEFDQLCTDTGGISNTEEFLKFLHRSGVVYYQKGVFGDRVVVDQTWALDAIYTVFLRRTRLQDAIQSGDGRFTRTTLDQHVWGEIRRTEKQEPYTIADQQTFLGLMVQCSICFKVREDYRKPDETEYIAPELLPPCGARRAARVDRWRSAPGPAATLRYDFLHDGVIRTFFAKIGEKAGEHAEYWKFGCFFYDQATDSEALIRVEPSTDPTTGAGAITLLACGAPGSKAARPDELLRTLVQVATDLPNVVRPRVEPPEYGTDPADRGRPVRSAPGPDRPDLPAATPADLLRPSFPPRTLFISYKHAESGHHVREAVSVLERATGHPSRVVWDDQLQTDQSVSEFVGRAGTIPVLVAVIGPRYLQSRYCLEELYTAWESSSCQWETFQTRVLPLILDDARIDDEDIRYDYGLYWLDQAQKLWPKGEVIGERGARRANRMKMWGLWLADALDHLNDPKLPRGWDDIRKGGFATTRQVLEERFRRLGVG